LRDVTVNKSWGSFEAAKEGWIKTVTASLATGKRAVTVSRVDQIWAQKPMRVSAVLQFGMPVRVAKWV
jgi:hypothetical protein